MAKRITVLASAQRTADATYDFENIDTYVGVLLMLDITAVAAGTLDVKLQYKDWLGGLYVDIPGASFAQKSGIGTDHLLVYPGATAVANESVNQMLIDTVRVNADVSGGGDLTFSISAVMLGQGLWQA